MERKLREGFNGAKREVIEHRGRYSIHCYTFPDSEQSDFLVVGPCFRHVVYDVSADDMEPILARLRAIIDDRQRPNWPLVLCVYCVGVAPISILLMEIGTSTSRGRLARDTSSAGTSS